MLTPDLCKHLELIILFIRLHVLATAVIALSVDASADCAQHFGNIGMLVLTGEGVLLQGHFQIVLNNEHCPLFQKDLGWFHRLMYCSGVWAYIVGAVTTPMFIIIPLVRTILPHQTTAG